MQLIGPSPSGAGHKKSTETWTVKVISNIAMWAGKPLEESKQKKWVVVLSLTPYS
jgi:hypothetical protein